MQLSRTFLAVAVVVAATLFSVNAVHSQIVNPSYQPPETEETPAWARLLYADDEQINVFEVEAAMEAYYRNRDVREKEFEAEEVEGGESEEEEDVYLWYYKLWRRSVEPYVQEDGSIVIPQVGAIGAADQRKKPREQVQTSGTSWSAVGPMKTHLIRDDELDSLQSVRMSQANVYCVDVAPSNGNILYCGTQTGTVFKTTNKGVTWVSASDNYNFAFGVTALAIHPTNPNRVYATSGGTYIVTTADGGATWSTSLTLRGLHCESIKIHQDNPDIIFAGGMKGLYRSTNAGTTWTTVIEGGPVWDIAINPTAGRRNEVYVVRKNSTATLCEFWKSTDYGETFSLRTTGWVAGVTWASGSRLAVTPADANRLYAVVLTSQGPYIMKSTNAGESWSTVATGGTPELGMDNGQGYYDLAILTSPSDANNLLVATTKMYKSTNGGMNFTALGGFTEPFKIHADIQAMVARGGDTWIATDGGLMYSTDFFTSATNATTRTEGVNASEYFGFGQGWNEDIMVGGRYHNGNAVMSEKYPDTSLDVGGAEEETGYVLHGRSGHVVFSNVGQRLTNFVVPSTIDQRALSSRFTFTKYPTDGRFPQGQRELEIHPPCYMQYWMAKDSTLWQSVSGGKTWNVVKNFGESVYQVEVSRSNPNVLYIITTHYLKKTVDGGTTWSNIVLPAELTISVIRSFRIALSYTDENELWMMAERGNHRVFRTSNGGETWENLSNSAMGSFGLSQSLVHQAGTNGGVYIASNAAPAEFSPVVPAIDESVRVLYRNNDMPDWVDCSQGLPKEFQVLKMIPFYRDGKLRIAGTRGIYEMPFYENSKPIAQITVDKTRTGCTRDTFYFDDYSVLKHEGATWQWSFPGASSVSSTTVRNPKVVYNTPGSYSVSLMVTQGSTSSSQTLNNFIVVDDSHACAADTVAGNALWLPNGIDYAVQEKALGITTNTFTISVWVKSDGTQLYPSYAVPLGLVITGNYNKSGLYWRANNQLGYAWGDVGTTWRNGPIVPPDQWNHVALVVTSTSATIYVNGIGSTHTAYHPLVYLDEPFYLGHNSYTTAKHAMKGSIDEVCFYNRALSRDEIRELMHLTKNNPNVGSKPAMDTSLIAYYQFNEASGTVYDKVGLHHIGLVEGAIRVPSDAPIGGGTSNTISVFSNGLYTFGNTGLKLFFRPGSTYPNGDVVAYRLNTSPDTTPQPVFLSKGYWIVRNYGVNSVISPLGRVHISGVAEVDSTMASAAPSVLLYQRTANATGATWGVPISKADIATTSGTVFFAGPIGAGLNVGDFGQFAIAACVAPTNLTTVFVGTTTAVVSWLPAVNAVDYTLSYKAVTSSTWIQIDGIMSMQYTMANLESGMEYEWRVRTRSTYTNSPYSVASTFATYCLAAGSITSYEYIDRVRIIGTTLDNTSGDNGGYGDYSGTVINLEPGSSYTIELTPGYPRGTSYAEGWQVWIDYNRDGDFDDADEQVGAKASLTTASVSFVVPANVALGTTRLRVSMRYYSYTDPCDTLLVYGEVEDYTVSFATASGIAVDAGTSEPKVGIPQNMLRVYPNPVDDVLHVEIDPQLIYNALSLEVVDAVGRSVYRLPQVSSRVVEIPMHGFARGTYFVVLRDNGHQYEVREVVKLERIR